MKKPSITLSPYLRIARKGCGINIQHATKRLTVRLTRGDETLATASAPRSGSVNAEEALRRVKLNQYGPTSSMYAVVSGFADIAEALENKNV